MTSLCNSPEKDVVLLIMKSPGNRKVITHLFDDQQLDFVAIDNETALATQLQQHRLARFALVDVAGLGQSIWRICERLRQASVPFVVLSPPQAMEASSNTLTYGALSLLQKPIPQAVLLKLIGSTLQKPGD
ncbi:MAG: response regulator [Pseudohongiellaceae bacterium]